MSEDYQRAENLIREAVGAGLRFETGAAITQQEVEDQLHRYAPRPGDTPATVEQKKSALQNFLKSMKAAVPQTGEAGVPQGGAPAGIDYARLSDVTSMSEEELERIAMGG